MRIKSLKFVATLLAALFSSATACTHAPERLPDDVVSHTTRSPSSNSTQQAQAKESQALPDQMQPAVLTLRAGQVLSLTAPVPRENSTELRQKYYQQAFPLAREKGLFRALALDVTDTLVGPFSPGGLVFFVWPDEQSETAFTSNPDWPAIKATRSDGWEHLRIYNSYVEKDVSIKFSRDKFYTAAVAWTNHDNPDDYERYLKNIENAVNEVGGRFIFKMNNIRFETHTAPYETPGQITFVEWDTKDGLQKLTSSDAYKQNTHLLRSGTTRFELHGVTPNAS